MKVNEMVESYIALRDRKSALKAQFDQKVAGIDDMLRKLEGSMLTHMNDTGAESINTSVGTAYKTTKTQVSPADWDAFLGFVIDHQSWEMLERRPAKNAVLEWEQENATLPPGLNKRVEVTVNIRRK